MASNHGVAYLGPGKVEVQIDRLSRSSSDPVRQGDPSRRHPEGRLARTSAARTSTWFAAAPRPRRGSILGHEITGEVIEKGKDVEFLEIGDLVTVPFNVACGRCRTCREGQHRHLPDREPGRAGRRLRLRRHGRMGRRPGRVRAGALRRLQPDQVPQQGAAPWRRSAT